MTERRREEVAGMDMAQLKSANDETNRRIKTLGKQSHILSGLIEESEYIGKRMGILRKAEQEEGKTDAT